jgi:hypothetical protein
MRQPHPCGSPRCQQMWHITASPRFARKPGRGGGASTGDEARTDGEESPRALLALQEQQHAHYGKPRKTCPPCEAPS